MIDTGTGLGLARRKPFIVKNSNDAGGQKRLGLLHVGIGAAEVAEDIAAAMHPLEIVACLAHCHNCFFNHSTAEAPFPWLARRQALPMDTLTQPAGHHYKSKPEDQKVNRLWC